MEYIEFEQVILQHKNINAAYIEFPFSVENIFGKKGQVKVKVVFDDKITYRGSLAKMDKNRHILGITQQIRKELGKTFGDIVKINLTEDTDERLVEIPKDVSEILNQNTDIQKIFNQLSYTQKKEYIRWINEAKKPETRQNRKNKLLEILREKIKSS